MCARTCVVGLVELFNCQGWDAEVGELVGEQEADGSAADDHHVVFVRHVDVPGD